MELRQLEYFVAVAEEGSFTAGALRARVAQPGVSAQVGRLEAELGERLLERTPKGTQLTSVGEAVLPHARAALTAAAAVRQTAAAASGLLVGRVVIGAVVGARGPAVTRVLTALHARHPNIEIALHEADPTTLMSGVRSGDFDIVLVGGAGAPVPGLRRHVVVEEELAAGVPHDHPLAGRREITLRTLAQQPIASLPYGTGTRSALEAGGTKLRITLEAGDPRTVADLAAKGLAIAVLPSSVIAARSANLHMLRIVRPVLRSRLEWLWRSGDLGPPARALVSLVRSRPDGA
jgi:DNA-binding transcriptional LysR family regulator